MKTLCCILFALSLRVGGEDLQIAVASNFLPTLRELVKVFEADSAYEVGLSPGSTGKLYAQILNGAPFDLFFAADAERPLLLEEKGVVIKGNRFSYAIGKLVLWSPRPDFIDDSGRILSTDHFRHLSIANPELAPYGLAAKELLKSLDLWEDLEPKLVRGANIAQTAQYVHSGAAELGFIALAQIQVPGKTISGSHWCPPTDSYPAIRQEGVVLTNTPAAEAFMAFMQTETAKDLIRAYGYDLPKEETHALVSGRP